MIPESEFQKGNITPFLTVYAIFSIKPEKFHWDCNQIHSYKKSFPIKTLVVSAKDLYKFYLSPANIYDFPLPPPDLDQTPKSYPWI